MPRKASAKPEETDEKNEKKNERSIWKKRRGTKAKARPAKKQRLAEGDGEPMASRPAVTLLPRVHQGFQGQMDDEVRPSDSISQVGIGPYEKEGFKGVAASGAGSVKSELISEVPRKKKEDPKKKDEVKKEDEPHVAMGPPRPVRRAVPGRDRTMHPFQSPIFPPPPPPPVTPDTPPAAETAPIQPLLSQPLIASAVPAASAPPCLGAGSVAPPGQLQLSTVPSRSSAAVSYTCGKDMVFVELCCGRNSCLRQACVKVSVSYIGCHDCLQEKLVQMDIIELLSSVCQGCRIEPRVHRRFELGQCGTKIHVHISLPCTGGSPILNFRQQPREKHVEIFEELANSVDCLLKKVEEVHGEVSKSLELPANNHYWKSEVLRKVLSNQHLEFEGIVNGCSMKMFTKSQQPVGKRFRFMSNRKEVANRLAERF